jgi:hypothetical protein
MKTKNNVQKTLLSTSAVIISLVLVSFTVTAQEFWKMVITNSSFNQIALALADTREKPKAELVNTETWVEKMNVAEEAEEALRVENWMKEPASFESQQLQVVPETENSLQVEAWMFDENNFGSTNNEEPLTTEEWMLNDKLWVR